MDDLKKNYPKVAIAGAGGFVGQSLTNRLKERFSVLALGRTRRNQTDDRVQWRVADLFSAGSVTEALRGAEVGIYLVHSMMPSSKLFQGDFHDTDLLLADNFANACRLNGVKQIIYLGGLLPDEGFVSPHLQSRYEVERVLSSSGVPVTIFRAGMIVGAGGSSFEILRSLVKKLPVMILPRWTERNTQAIYIDDVVRVIEAAILNPVFQGKTFNLVNGEALTYRLLLEKTAKMLGVHRLMLPVPIDSTGFSKLWVQIFGNSPRELVSPLIDSLLCDLPQLKPVPEIKPHVEFPDYESMFKEPGLRGDEKISAGKRKVIKKEGSVRSIQRLPPMNKDAHWIAMEYMKWLPSFFPQILRVEVMESERKINFYLRFFAKPLLELTLVKNSLDLQREKFHITGGLLSRTSNTGWLEFRQMDHKRFTLVSIHEFYPRLPWLIYRFTQAPLHRMVMLAFGRHLQEVTRSERKS